MHWGTALISFQDVSGLDTEAQPIEYRHGDSPVFSTIKIPGLKKYGNVMLKNGVFASDDQFWDWFNQTQRNIQRAGLTISLVDESGVPAIAWTLAKAWPTKATGVVSNVDNTAVTISTLEIVHEGITIANA